nr:hypothetical protein [Tanacetum cinerariifolium]
EAVNEEMDDSLERAATTATSLDAEWWSQVPRSHGDAAAQTRSERVSKVFNDPLLAGVNIPRSGKDSLKLNEFIELCTNLLQRVLALETTKTTQALEIDSLKRRVKKLERRKRSRTYGLEILYKVGLSARVESSADEGLVEEDASKQGRIADIEPNKDIYLNMLFDIPDDLRGEEVFISQQFPLNVVAAITTTAIIDDITLAQALAELKSAKPKAATTTATTTITAASLRPKAKGIVIHDQEQEPTPIISSQQSSQVKDKGK